MIPPKDEIELWVILIALPALVILYILVMSFMFRQ